MSSLQKIIDELKQNKVVAYPTEAVFGLGCNPFSQEAVYKILDLKNRPVEKGLIVISPNIDLLKPYIAMDKLNAGQLNLLQTPRKCPTSWVVPIKKQVPKFITGEFDSLAVRVTTHPLVAKLCYGANMAIISTSANLSGAPPSRSAEEVTKQFGVDLPVLEGQVGGEKNPSEIRDIFTQKVIRQG